jgi:hypothetical protein
MINTNNQRIQIIGMAITKKVSNQSMVHLMFLFQEIEIQALNPNW